MSGIVSFFLSLTYCGLVSRILKRCSTLYNIHPLDNRLNARLIIFILFELWTCQANAAGTVSDENEQKSWMHSMHAFHNCINICELCKEVVKLTFKFTHSVDRICKYQEPYDVFYIQFHAMWQITTKQLHIFIVCSKHTLAKLLCNLLC